MFDLHPLFALGVAVVAAIAWFVGNHFVNDGARREREELRKERAALAAQERAWRAQAHDARAAAPAPPKRPGRELARTAGAGSAEGISVLPAAAPRTGRKGAGNQVPRGQTSAAPAQRSSKRARSH